LTTQRPDGPIGEVFVNHPFAVQSLRAKLATFFSLHTPQISPHEMESRLNHRGLHHMEIAAEILGSDVPFYTVTVE
jgi:hypothetical protein